MFSDIIIEYVKKYLPDSKFPTNYFGKWRYHNWECDTELGIWSIHFGKYKLVSKKRYEKDLSKINEFILYFKFNEKSKEVEINENNIYIAFDIIKEIIDSESFIKSINLEVNEKIDKLNKSDKEVLREIKLNKILK